jgi:HEAT repeat protein
MNSRRFNRFRLWLPVALLLSATCSGCSSARPEWIQNMAFWEGTKDTDPLGTLAPKQQMTELQELRAALPEKPAEEHRVKAAELAQRYRNESDPLLRAQVVRTIARCASPEAGDTLRAALQDSERDVRIAACEGWGEHGGPQAAGLLGQAVRRDKSPDVKLAAARGLGKLKDPEVATMLAPALDDPDPALQYRAVQSLRESTGKDFGDSVAAWREFVRGGAPQEISTAQRMKLDYF